MAYSSYRHRGVFGATIADSVIAHMKNSAACSDNVANRHNSSKIGCGGRTRATAFRNIIIEDPASQNVECNEEFFRL